MTLTDPDATFRHEGNALDHTAAADLAAGEVVTVGTIIGVTASPIKSGEKGALQVEGVFSMKKDGLAKTAGESVQWDGSQITSGGAHGVAAADAGAGDSHVLVKLTPG